MLEWIVMIGLAIALYVIIYKYEKKIDDLHKKIDDNKERIDHNHSKIKENYNHIEKLWVNVPSTKVKKEATEEEGK